MLKTIAPFAPTSADTGARREELRHRMAPLGLGGASGLEALRAVWERIHEVAEELSGSSRDGQHRAVTYYALYEDSEGGFMFPLVASHGSLWGVRHTERLERWLGLLLPVSRHGRVQRWLDALDAVRDVNRRVFVEIVSTFYFTRFFGRHELADQVVNPEVLALYNRVHAAISSAEPLDRSERRAIYYDVFVHEQDDIVHPGILEAIDMADSPWLNSIFKRVSPRFAYFPPGQRLFFTDFTSVDQRNREGLRALDFAEEVGAGRVLEAMADYGVHAPIS